MENKKILFAGLDNAGKTSIISSFQNRFNFTRTKPTIGVERKNLQHMNWLGLNIISWDLGGQERFRMNHFSNPKIFHTIYYLFYVIDIQDLKRHEESLGYLEKITKLLKKTNDDANIVICFNKYDPDIIEEYQYQRAEDHLKLKIREITQKFEIKFFKTSIYDQSSMIRLFSESLIKNSAKGKLIQKYLNEYGKLTFSSATVLMDKNCLIVGSQYSNEYYKDMCEYIASWMILAMEKIKNFKIFFKNIAGNIDYFMDEQAQDEKQNKAIVFIEKFCLKENWEFVIISLTRNKTTSRLSKKYLPQLAEQLALLL